MMGVDAMSQDVAHLVGGIGRHLERGKKTKAAVVSDRPSTFHAIESVVVGQRHQADSIVGCQLGYLVRVAPAIAGRRMHVEIGQHLVSLPAQLALSEEKKLLVEVTVFSGRAVGLNKCCRQPVVYRGEEMLGELEVIRLIEENDYPARVIEIGVVWIELEITDAKSNSVRRERLSKSAFADLILDWRERRKRNVREIAPALRKIGIAA